MRSDGTRAIRKQAARGVVALASAAVVGLAAVPARAGPGCNGAYELTCGSIAAQAAVAVVAPGLAKSASAGLPEVDLGPGCELPDGVFAAHVEAWIKVIDGIAALDANAKAQAKAHVAKSFDDLAADVQESLFRLPDHMVVTQIGKPALGLVKVEVSLVDEHTQTQVHRQGLAKAASCELVVGGTGAGAGEMTAAFGAGALAHWGLLAKPKQQMASFQAGVLGLGYVEGKALVAVDLALDVTLEVIPAAPPQGPAFGKLLSKWKGPSG